MLQIKDLHVEIDGKEIVKGVNLKINSGEVHAIMGENGSGKSSLALCVAGHPRYKITKGEILFNGTNVLNLDAGERARMGMFLSMQSPPEIEGLRFSRFLSEAKKSMNAGVVNIIEFQKQIQQNAFEFGLEEQVLGRSVNLGLSGGEKKKSEMLQLSLLNPKFAIFDEIDSGLDVDSLRNVALGVNKFKNKDNSCLLITHYKRILNYVKPDYIHIMIDGKIVKTGGFDLADEIEDKGYALLK